jgi:hypothetical protein
MSLWWWLLAWLLLPFWEVARGWLPGPAQPPWVGPVALVAVIVAVVASLAVLALVTVLAWCLVWWVKSLTFWFST